MTDKEKTPEYSLPETSVKTTSGRNWTVPIIFVVLVVAAVIAILLLRSGGPQEEKEKEAEIKVSVKVAKAERTSITSTVHAVGTITPKQQATVSPKISAPIAAMGLIKNKAVKDGEVIAQLEARDLRAQRSEAASALAEAQSNLRGLSAGTIPLGNAQAEKDLRDAQANVDNTRATLERRRVLFERGGISKKDLEASELAYTQALDAQRLAQQASELKTKVTNATDRSQSEAKVNQAEQRLANLDAQLSYATIRAPFTGVITDQFQYKGEFATAGAKLVTIADMSEVIAKAPFADSVVAGLKVGDEVTVKPADLPDQDITGSVTLISRSTDPANRTVEVWVNLKNPYGRIRAGSAADVIITNKSVDNAVVVPVSAVTLDASNGNEGTVMVVDDKSVAKSTKVTIGIRNAESMQILSGLEGGETVVIEGNYALPDGTSVEIATDDEKGDKEAAGDDKKPADDKKADDEKKPADDEKKAPEKAPAKKDDKADKKDSGAKKTDDSKSGAKK